MPGPGAAPPVSPWRLGRAGRLAVFAIGCGVYGWRALSCSLALGRFSTVDPVPYARFDYHGMLGMAGFATALVFAGPIAWLGWQVLLGRTEPANAGVAQRAGRGAAPAALIVAFPSAAQVIYLVHLPVPIVEPIILSAIAWGMVVALGWWHFRHRPDREALVARLRRPVALVLAVIMAGKAVMLAPLLALLPGLIAR